MKKNDKFFNSKRVKGLIFFACYLVFFILLFNYIDLDKGNNSNNQESGQNNNQSNNQNNNTSSYYQTKNLENSNYSYKITIKENDLEKTLEGSKNNQESITNYEYFKLVDFNEVKRIIKNAKFISKNQDNNNYRVNYEIENKDLYELFEISNILDYEEKINNIVLILNENHDLIKIELDFSNYIESINENIFRYKVLIEYEY